MLDNALLNRAQTWLAADPDPETAAELQALIIAAQRPDQHAATALADRFNGMLTFGTAGLRAELGAGPRRMNRIVVQQTTAGFAAFLNNRAARGEIHNKRVVIGFDARKNSAIFARDAAEIFAGAGFQALLLPGPLPTPITAYAVRKLAAAAGVMITASHNPPNDNGYKVYLGDADAGSQITPPADAQIAALIATAAQQPLTAYPRAPEAVTELGSEIIYDYLQATAASVLEREHTGAGIHPKIVYTALHGVGAAPTISLFAAAGLPALQQVTEQCTPDGNFPTVEFPNPEETGALNLAIATAQRLQADAIIAHDPDADRLAVALPVRATTNDVHTPPEQWQMLTGNQVGLLLGWRAARKAHNAARTAGTTPDKLQPQPALACTIVSSPVLQAVAKHYGLAYAETLPGFKWVSRVPGLIFGFEEALGYLVNPETVRDKDGISAAAAITEMLTELHAQGRTLWDELAAATALFGHFASTQITIRLDNSAAVTAIAEKLRANPPTAFGSFQVVEYTDLAKSENPDLRANVLRFDLHNSSRVMVRPSGTEPKLKIYLDSHCTTGTVAARQAQAETNITELAAAIRNTLTTVT